MKAIFYFLLGVTLCLSVTNVLHAQEVENQQEAFANKEWFLTKVVMEGEEYPFVPSGAVAISTLTTENLYVNDNGDVFCPVFINHCEMCGEDVLFVGAFEFKTYEGMQTWNCLADDNCMYSTDTELLAFAALYEIQFWGGENTFETHYEINITEEEEDLTLIITKDDGNQAFYSNEPLSFQSLEKNEITLYPNPADNFLHIENLTESVQIEIYDLSGKVLLSQEINEAEKRVNLSRLGEGIYLYQLRQQGKNIKTGKLVKK